MPFDFKKYDEKCNGLTPEELQREWQHYTRLISGAATSTAVSGLAVPLTLGVSTIGVAMAAPAIHNARKKREIIEKHLNKHAATHVTRKRDVLGSMAFSGTIGVVTLGVGTMGAEAVASTGAEHGISAIANNETAIKVVTHAALDGAGMAVEHAHTSHLKKKDAFKAFQKAGVFEAVQDAKAAEAGYTIAPYDPNAAGSSAAGGSSEQYQQFQPLPPPPYNVAVADPQFQTPTQPGYYTNPTTYTPVDFKPPASPMPPAAYGQPPQMTPQYVPQFQQQQPSQFAPDPTSSIASIAPPTEASYYPQTPGSGYPPSVVQPVDASQTMAVNQQQPPIQPQTTWPSTTPTYTPAPPSGAYDMKAMAGALPNQNAGATAAPGQQDVQSQQAYQPPTAPGANTQVPVGHHQRSQSIAQPTPQAYASTPIQPTYSDGSVQIPTGYPPPVSQPLQSPSQSQEAAAVSALTQPPEGSQGHVVIPGTSQPPIGQNSAQGFAVPPTQQTSEYQTATAPQHGQVQTGYATPQQTGQYQANGQVPPPANSTRRDSAINPLQPPVTQPYAPTPQTGYTYSTTPVPPSQPIQQAQYQASSLPPPPPPPPPPPSASQPPVAVNETQQYQYSTGTYTSVQTPVAQQQQYQQPVEPIASPQQYQAQYNQQPQVPSYPPTPASLPSQVPTAQHTSVQSTGGQYQYQQQYEPVAPPQQYQPQYQSQQYQPQQPFSYPPTPASLPSQTPAAQYNTGSSYFPPPPTGKQPQAVGSVQQGQPQQWNAQAPGHMPYTPAASPGTMWQPQAIAQVYGQHQQ
ncbi:hypothetical protein EDB81DRAFT_814180 [Dactylonectria macrodidyma]|uniref:Uncharacterized protein n=1 Tax=Dactylonectria macrodidyma TaxID=307937 RepID=A0A9P9DMI5_9HYPO|nr:hypothetical protein EDB81DRAFT_814180 [Dactylonectria macrodidyma]